MTILTALAVLIPLLLIIGLGFYISAVLTLAIQGTLQNLRQSRVKSDLSVTPLSGTNPHIA